MGRANRGGGKVCLDVNKVPGSRVRAWASTEPSRRKRGDRPSRPEPSPRDRTREDTIHATSFSTWLCCKEQRNAEYHTTKIITSGTTGSRSGVWDGAGGIRTGDRRPARAGRCRSQGKAEGICCNRTIPQVRVHGFHARLDRDRHQLWVVGSSNERKTMGPDGYDGP